MSNLWTMQRFKLRQGKEAPKHLYELKALDWLTIWFKRCSQKFRPT